ncbi:MAG: hypothetical protein ACRYE9_05325 [Janthinobacterium lividum]
MLKIFRFFLSVILFIPKLILDSIFGFFKLILLLVIVVTAVFYAGNYSIKSFFSGTHGEAGKEISSKKEGH